MPKIRDSPSARAALGDPALTELCHREFPRLVGLVALRVGDRGVAEELAQDALVRLCQKWPDVDRHGPWLTRVALNLSNSWLRRRFAEHRAYRRRGLAAAVEQAPDVAGRLALRQAVSQLPRRQQTALILRYYEQMSVTETADLMRCPEGTVKALTHRALKRLRTEHAQEVIENA